MLSGENVNEFIVRLVMGAISGQTPDEFVKQELRFLSCEKCRMDFSLHEDKEGYYHKERWTFPCKSLVKCPVCKMEAYRISSPGLKKDTVICYNCGKSSLIDTQ